ncbi:MAG: DUF1440 domain-containing protein [Rhizobacter sp.]|nr:DUF1440 domain-containing protein [Ferruginibacter sp.]
MKNNSIKTIFTAGLTAAILDIAGAIIVYAFILDISTAQKVLQSVAAGALGKPAFTGGWSTAIAGLGFHTLIALCFAAFHYIIYPYWKKVFTNAWVAGFIYGCVVWGVMNLIVLPVISGKPFVFNLKFFLYGIGLIIFLVGIPISLITDKMRRDI